MAIAAFLLLAQGIISSAVVVRYPSLHEGLDLLGHMNLSALTTNMINNTATQFVHNHIHEIEFAIADEKKVKDKILYVALAMLFGLCGCDRCYMDQVMCGVFKCCTLGGCGCWAMVDYYVCVYIALTKVQSINMLGYSSSFDPSTIDGAFWLSLLLFAFQLLSSLRSGNGFQQQLKFQSELLQELEATEASAGEGQGKRSGSDDPPRDSVRVRAQHQPLVLLPAFATKTLRTLGAVGEQVSFPEAAALFKELDKNGDGVVDEKELREGLAAIGVGEGKLKDIMAKADVNGDGRLDRKEFFQAFASPS